MELSEIASQRLHTQHLSRQEFTRPEEIVRWLGAVQSQDYGAAKWALGLRLYGATDEAIDRAFADGTILRTHVMRPTWHFVTPEDIRWLLDLTAPRVRTLMSYMDRQVGLDDALCARSNDALVRALEGGKQLTRAEIAAVFEQAGIESIDTRFTYLMIRAELDKLVCSGGRQGKQFNYALLEERAPQAKRLQRDEALAELARRYFTGHGPATLKDYVWWSGLTVADAKAGIEMVRSVLIEEVVEGESYWFSEKAVTTKNNAAYLLPNFDEYIVGYTDRSAAFDVQQSDKLDPRGNVLFQHTMMVDGRIVGTWKRTLKKGTVLIELSPFYPLSETENRLFAEASQRYGDFLNLAVVLAAKP